MSLKGLMHWRRLMDSSRDGFEVFDVEYPRIEITIPADDIEGMVIENMLAQPVPHFDADFKLTALGVCLQVFRQTDVAFAIGRVFEHLTELIPVTLWRLDL